MKLKITPMEPRKTVPTIIRPDWDSAQGDKWSMPMDQMEGGALKQDEMMNCPVKPDMLRDELPVEDKCGIRKDMPVNTTEKIGYQGEGG